MSLSQHQQAVAGSSLTPATSVSPKSLKSTTSSSDSSRGAAGSFWAAGILTTPAPGIEGAVGRVLDWCGAHTLIANGPWHRWYSGIQSNPAAQMKKSPLHPAISTSRRLTFAPRWGRAGVHDILLPLPRPLLEPGPEGVVVKHNGGCHCHVQARRAWPVLRDVDEGIAVAHLPGTQALALWQIGGAGEGGLNGWTMGYAAFKRHVRQCPHRTKLPRFRA